MNNWEKYLHPVYVLVGHTVCRILLCVTKIRDRIIPPKAETILLVAHPDDDALFFHTYIKAQKPYVVLLMTGWSLRRLIDFFSTMRYYGVRCRAYDLVSAKAKDAEPRWYNTLEREVRESLSAGQFREVATHSMNGEYGHVSHKAVHKAVKNVCTGRYPYILTPALMDEVARHPLNEEALQEKENIFKTIYTTEAWVMDQYKMWFENEYLVREDI